MNTDQTVISPLSPSNTTSASLRLLFLGAGTPWVYALAEALAIEGNNVSAIAPLDTVTFKRQHPQWPSRQQPAQLHREFWVYPPGYAGTLAPLFAPLLRSRLTKTFPPETATEGSNVVPWVIAPYPWSAKALRRIPSRRLIYYNLDDYVQYQPERAASILANEAELVRRASLTLCLSQRQVHALRNRFPERTESILHFPLAAVEDLINPTPSKIAAGNVVGYIGNLIDRVDWRLVADVARRLPDVEFHFIGGLDGFSGGGVTPNWQIDRAAALALPNVRHIGPIAQDDVGKYYFDFTVNWIPYDLGHAFNQASCPTKIMDGLASARPLLSTDIPECRLYPEYISIFHSVDDAVSQIQRTLSTASDASAKESAQKQAEFVRRNHTWSIRAQWLTQRLWVVN